MKKLSQKELYPPCCPSTAAAFGFAHPAAGRKELKMFAVTLAALRVPLRFILHAYIFISISKYAYTENEEGVLAFLRLSQITGPGSSLPSLES